MSLNPQSDLLFWLGLYEKETHCALQQTMQSCNSFVDLGAGRGELVLHILKTFPGKQVVAVEPDDIARERLESNLTLNGIYPPFDLKILGIYCGTNAPEPCLSLERIADNLTDPVFLKIDIDGPEADILEESLEWLKLHLPRIFIEVHSAEAEKRILDLLHSLQYQTTIINPAWWRLLIPEQRPIEHNRWLIGVRK